VTSMRRWWLLASPMVVLASGVLTASAAWADRDPWVAGSNWLFVRAGYARNGAANAASGGEGFRHVLRTSKVNDWKLLGVKPLGFLHWTLFKNCSIGAFAEYDVLGRFGSASEIEIPAAVELTRFFMWKSAARPYVTLGTGPFYRKTYRTGNDFARVTVGNFVATGFDTPVAPNQMLGFDVRLARVNSENNPVNPVFGAGQNKVTDSGGVNHKATHWSAKLAYSVHY